MTPRIHEGKQPMAGEAKEKLDEQAIKKILKAHRLQMKLALRICVHCSLCAESCFLYLTRGKKPEYVPSHKVIHSVGKLYKKKGNYSPPDI